MLATSTAASYGLGVFLYYYLCRAPSDRTSQPHLSFAVGKTTPVVMRRNREAQEGVPLLARAQGERARWHVQALP